MQKLRNYFTSIPAWFQVLVFLLMFLVMLILAGALGALLPPGLNSLFYGLFGCLGGLLILWIFSRKYPETWEISGMLWHRQSILKFLAGAAIGIAVFVPLVGLLIFFSPLELKPSANTFNSSALLTFLPIFLLALAEEIGFRSFPQQVLAQRYGIWISQFVMAIVFGLFHIFYGWDPVVAFSGPFVWAFLFGLSAIVSKGIAVPTGIHFSLNILQALAGMKGKDQYSIFLMDYLPGTSQAEIAATEKLGFGLHAALFVIFIAATYFYQRNYLMFERR